VTTPLAVNILEHLQAPQLRQPELVEKAMGRQALALLAMLDAACTAPRSSHRPQPKNSANTPTTP
jgi:hypothetical protein